MDGDESKLPGLSGCAETYADAWDHFGDESFDVDDLRKSLITETATRDSSDIDDVPGVSALNSRLYRLAAFGLVKWFGKGRYQIWCAPDEDPNAWNKKIVDRVPELHERLKEEVESRERRTMEQKQGSEPKKIEYDGDDYLQAFVGKDTDLDGQAGYYYSVLDADQDVAGVVLCAYGRLVDHVDNLAEDICDDEKMAETMCPFRFEQVASDLHRNEDDELVYRVYLRETRFLNN